MIKIKKNEKEIIIKGHAQAENYGKDLVCAAVSTLVFSTLSSLTLPRKIKENCVIINLPSAIDHDNQIRLETFWKSLLIIKNQYPDFIDLQSQEKIILNKEQQEINLQFFASKKGVSSTKNGRDSNSKRLGIKKSDGSKVKAGNILYRQRGTKILAGDNVLRGGDDTLFSVIDGIVKYKHVHRNKIKVSVFPKEIKKI